MQRYDPRAFALKGSAGAPRMADLPRGPRGDRLKRPTAAAACPDNGHTVAAQPVPLSQNSFAIEPLRSQANWDASSNGHQSFATQVGTPAQCMILS